ncbi:MAG: hypothetical protein WCL44_10135 [bacterium]
MRNAKTFLLVSTMCGLVVAGCATSPSYKEKTPYHVTIVPSEFSTDLTNPYLAWTPGKQMTYEGKTDEGYEKVVVHVTADTKIVMGVTCVVVQDTLWVDGEMAESTADFFAQAKNGDVWYFGEECKKFKDKKLASTEGSWEAGVNGALPGVIVHAVPQIGVPHRLEYLAGIAEDMAEAQAVNVSVTVPYGTFTNCMQTRDWSLVESGLERKYYSPGVGLIEEETVKGGWGKIKLTNITKE